MCESTVYVLRNGEEQIFFEDVDTLENSNGEIKLFKYYGVKRKRSAEPSSSFHSLIIK